MVVKTKILFTNMKYEEKILSWILGLKPGEKHFVNKLTNEPDKFTSAVKNLFNEGYISTSGYEFSGDYKSFRRMSTMEGYGRDFYKQYANILKTNLKKLI